MADFNIKQGDTGPALIYELLPVTTDLTGASVVFNMRTSSGTVVVDRQDALIITETGSPTVRYDWSAGETDIVGSHQAEFEVTYADGMVETFPNRNFISITVWDDIA